MTPISPSLLSPEEMLEDGKIDKNELHKLLTELLAQLKVNQNLDFLENNYAEISPIRSKAYYEDLLPERGQALIEKAGLFSLFEVQKQNIINDYQTLKESFEPKEITLKEDFQSFSSVATDPSQQEILEGLRTQSRILIQGPPGTGKVKPSRRCWLMLWKTNKKHWSFVRNKLPWRYSIMP